MGKKIWNVTVTLLLVAAFALAVAFAGVRLVGLTPFTVTSGSMEPLYPVGSIVYVKKVTPSEIAVGDAITFHLSGGAIATHQVWAIEGESFRTQGIANRTPEGAIQHDAAPVPFDDLIGKPVACIPGLGYLYTAIRTPVGLCVLVFLAAGTCLISLLVDSGKPAPPKKGGKRLQHKNPGKGEEHDDKP